jgi:hypothetical protein
MLVAKGLDPLLLTEQKMLDQASSATATIKVSDIAIDERAGVLRATVTIESATGHKFPSGVGFRRAFVDFQVQDQLGNVLWQSGATNDAGVIVDQNGEPVEGELWWKSDCSGYLRPDQPVHQPHYQKITRQTEAQIYQELVTAPAQNLRRGQAPQCGDDPTPGGKLTTSFLSICGHVKDNRILPAGFLSLNERVEISEALGAGRDMAVDSGAFAVGDDPDYTSGGGDSLVYEVPLAELGGKAAGVSATLNYQAIPPFYLQDRFCTAKGADTQRLYFLGAHLNLEGTEAAGWKFLVTKSDVVPVASAPVR